MVFSLSLNSLKATQRVTMSSDFSDNSDRVGSWKRTRLLRGNAALLSSGEYILRLAFPLGFVAWSDRCEAQPPPTPPSGVWVSTAALHILAPEPVAFSCAEPAKLCHLGHTIYPHFSILSLLPFFRNFLHSSVVSTPAQYIPHINPHGPDNPHYVFMSCSLLILSLSLSLSLPHSYALSFVLLTPMASPFDSPTQEPWVFKNKKMYIRNHLNSLLNVFPLW